MGNGLFLVVVVVVIVVVRGGGRGVGAEVSLGGNFWVGNVRQRMFLHLALRILINFLFLEELLKPEFCLSLYFFFLLAF
jgi:hypothetical protein